MTYKYAGIFGAGVLGMLVPCGTNAQDLGNDAAQGERDVIVVTARKIEENLQNVPVAVTVYNQDLIAMAGIDDIREVADMSASVFLPRPGNSVQPVFVFRGVGSAVGSSPGVGFFIDGVQREFANQDIALFDVERIEILKGPQGTLYGRNTLAGVINVTTRKPNNEFRGFAEASYARSNTYKLAGSVSGPLVADKAFLGIAAQHYETDGQFNNSIDGRDLDFEERSNFRATGRALITPDIEAVAVLEYEDLEEGAFYLGPVAGVNDFRPDIALDHENLLTREVFAPSLTLAYHGDGLEVTSITGATFVDFTNTLDGDFTAFPVTVIDQDRERTTITQELRVSKSFSDNMNLLIGAFAYFDENDSAQTVRVIPLDLDIPSGAVTEETNLALFGEWAFFPIPRLEASVGARVDYSDQSFEGISGLMIDSSQTEFIPRGTLTYFWSDEIMTYVSVSKGYRVGGFNPAGLPGEEAFGAEKTWNYELGFKSTLFDGDVNFNGAVFWIDWTDQQQAIQGVNPIRNITLNLGDTRNIGFELEAFVHASDRFQFSGGVTYIDAEIKELSFNGLDFSDQNSVLAPDWSATVGGQYVHPLPGGSSVIGRIDARYFGEYALNLGQATNPDYVLTDLRVTWQNENFRLYGFVENLFDTEFNGNFLADFPLATGVSDIALPGDKRHYGVGFRYSW